MVNQSEGYKAVTIYQAVHRDGHALFGKKIGIGMWNLEEGKLTMTAVDDRVMQAIAFHNQIEVLLADYNVNWPVALAVGYWKITEGFTTGDFEEMTEAEQKSQEDQLSN